MRDVLIISAACLIAIAVGAWLFVSGSESKQETGEVRYSTLTEGPYAGALTERKNYRIKSREEFDQLWQMIYAGDGPNIPYIDFAESEVLAVFDGTHTTGGYAIEVASVEDNGSRRIIIKHISPGETCMTTGSITSPFALVMLPKTTLPIVREDVEEVRECQ